ncbi:MAG: hypothetical protein ACXWP5_12445 [Bdellovibrionota bacterium]
MSPSRRNKLFIAVLIAAMIFGYANRRRFAPSNAQPANQPAPSAPSVNQPQAAAAPAKQTPAISPAKSQATLPSAPAPKIAKRPTCFTLDYHHLPTAGHIDEESCSQHRNLLKLKHSRPLAVCVRVNGRPVRFQRVKGRSDELMLEPVAGPQSKISIRYCTEKSGCPAQDCKVPKDEFMSALGGEANDGPADGGVWDPSEAKETARMNGELRRELAELDSASGTDTGASHLFKGWTLDQVSEGCENTGTAAQARN